MPLARRRKRELAGSRHRHLAMAVKKSARRSVSRVLYRFVLAKKAATAIHLGERLHVRSSNQPGRLGVKTRLPQPLSDLGAPSLFGLAPGGACHACSVASAAVRSYRTFSPLSASALRAPARQALGGLSRHSGASRGDGRYLLCGAFPQRAHRWTRRPGVTRRLVSMEPGLSSRLRSASFGATGPLCE